mmetsp:Transcript_25971/g.103877  ORF Transcript_25971/g.103877 Transcript_25971/m.103877 type:complete len:203 (-) Transcript_25971:1191-1799(-)
MRSTLRSAVLFPVRGWTLLRRGARRSEPPRGSPTRRPRSPENSQFWSTHRLHLPATAPFRRPTSFRPNHPPRRLTITRGHHRHHRRRQRRPPAATPSSRPWSSKELWRTTPVCAPLWSLVALPVCPSRVSACSSLPRPRRPEQPCVLLAHIVVYNKNCVGTARPHLVSQHRQHHHWPRASLSPVSDYLPETLAGVLNSYAPF